MLRCANAVSTHVIPYVVDKQMYESDLKTRAEDDPMAASQRLFLVGVFFVFLPRTRNLLGTPEFCISLLYRLFKRIHINGGPVLSGRLKTETYLRNR
jgi:hypothetical protein